LLLLGCCAPANDQLSGTVIAGCRNGTWWVIVLGITGGWVVDLRRGRVR
jgi:hypothetical protein